jgi:hypothetical protein
MRFMAHPVKHENTIRCMSQVARFTLKVSFGLFTGDWQLATAFWEQSIMPLRFDKLWRTQ